MAKRELQYRVTDLPTTWPGKRTAHPKPAPFKTQWNRLTSQLARELDHLGAKNVEIQLDLPRGLVDLRNDGMLRADARPRHPVILTFTDREGNRQAYPCDTFGWWQDNLWAIAVVLEDLRRAERYGVQSALLRAGFKALPAAGKSSETMTARAAALVLATYDSGTSADIILERRDAARLALRIARSVSHPDRHEGDHTRWDEVERARVVLEAHFGGGL